VPFLFLRRLGTVFFDTYQVRKTTVLRPSVVTGFSLTKCAIGPTLVSRRHPLHTPTSELTSGSLFANDFLSRHSMDLGMLPCGVVCVMLAGNFCFPHFDAYWTPGPPNWRLAYRTGGHSSVARLLGSSRGALRVVRRVFGGVRGCSRSAPTYFFSSRGFFFFVPRFPIDRWPSISAPTPWRDSCLLSNVLLVIDRFGACPPLCPHLPSHTAEQRSRPRFRALTPHVTVRNLVPGKLFFRNPTSFNKTPGWFSPRLARVMVPFLLKVATFP